MGKDLPALANLKKPYAMEVAEVAEALASDPQQGLSEAEAAERLERFGANQLPEQKKPSSLKRFLLQFNDILIYVLLAAAVLTAALGHWIDTAVILAVVVINALIGFIQEGKAEKALDSIRGMLTTKAVVVRDGKQSKIPMEELVPGDRVLLRAGDRVPADLRIVQARSLRIEEAALTGESVPTSKRVEPSEEEATVGDRNSMAFSGTIVTSGRGAGLVVATGANTELGRISQMVADAAALQTPLTRQLARFGKVLTAVILAMSVAILAVAIAIHRMPLAEAIMAVVGIAVAAIPEGLPAIVSITLALGVLTMAQRNAIIRKLPAVETLGSVSVICSDKTGTLTKGEMTAASVVTRKGLATVSGLGYEPEGEVRLGKSVTSPKDGSPLALLIEVGVLCNDSRLREKGGRWSIEGEPTEGALIVLGAKFGFDREALESQNPRLDTLPFDSEHKFMATLHRGEPQNRILMKGAPEPVLQRCTQQLGAEGELEPLDEEFWHTKMEDIAERGERLLAFAYKLSDIDEVDFRDVEAGLVFLGFVGIIDPPRDEAIAAVEECRQAGIQVVMITGDHAKTATAIAERIGLDTKEPAVTGARLEKMDQEELKTHAARVTVFARTSPEHKLRLVQALQAKGKIVAMTGDGVNDAPALKAADVGVAMGIKGTEAAKEAAEMVLADDNFATIAYAVGEGRKIYDNIRKTIWFILPTNGAQALVIIAALLIGGILPITPTQILWVNMITAVTLGLALAFEPAEKDVMKRPPRNPREPLVTKLALWRIAFVSVIIMIGTVSIFEYSVMQGYSMEVARTLAVGAIISAQAFYLLNSRFATDSSLRLDVLWRNRAVAIAIGIVVLAQLGLTYLPFMNTVFGTEPVSAYFWLPILGVGLAVFFLVEIEKAIIRRMRAQPQLRRNSDS